MSMSLFYCLCDQYQNAIWLLDNTTKIEKGGSLSHPFVQIIFSLVFELNDFLSSQMVHTISSVNALK